MRPIEVWSKNYTVVVICCIGHNRLSRIPIYSLITVSVKSYCVVNLMT